LVALKQAYRNRGYLDVRIANEETNTVVAYRDENREADVLLEVAEGPQYRVSRIEIEGLTSTREAIARREAAFEPGEVLGEIKMLETESRLRRLGLFSSVSVRAIDDAEKPGFKVVRISLQEGVPGIVGGGLGFRNDLGARFFGQVGYSNLWGANHTLALNAAVNRRVLNQFCAESPCFWEYQAQLAYNWPWFLAPQLTFRPRVTAENIRYINFDAETRSIGASLERQILSWPNLSGSLLYSFERTRQSNAKAEIDNRVLQIGSVTPALKLDLRDNPLAPTSGFFAQVSYEVASTSLGSSSLGTSGEYPVGYTRFQFRSDAFFPLAREIGWYLSFRTGLARNTEPPPEDRPNDPNYAIPLVKQFAIGGAGSLRGFREQELNAQRFAIRGTLSYVNYRTQLDLPFAGPMRFGPFLDGANLNIDSFSFGDLRYGTGVGFRYQSPVGPVNFDWGFKIRPRAGEDTQQFYFSIGVI
jgi:outer membrane protein insertion porin family